MPIANKQVDTLRMIEVNSSNIVSVGYDPQKSILIVKFAAGRTYDYMNVEEDVYALLAQAARTAGASVGQVFNLLVRSHPEKYPYVERSEQ